MRVVSPLGFLGTALVIVCVFCVTHLLGWREETRFLSGTSAAVHQGLVYLLAYFAFVLVAPTLVLGAGVFALLERVTGGRGEESPHV